MYRSLIALVLLTTSFGVALAESDGIVIAPAPADIAKYEPMPAASRVTINGRPAHVYSFLVAGKKELGGRTLPSNFAQFDLRPGARAIISATFAMPITKATVLPKRVGLHPTVSGRTVTFVIERPGHYDLEINDAVSNPTNANAPLLVFADTPEEDPPSGPNVTVFPTGHVVDLTSDLPCQNVNVAPPTFCLPTQAGHTYVIPAGAVVRGVFLTDGQSNVTLQGHGLIFYDADVETHNNSASNLAHLTSLFAYNASNFTARGLIFVMAVHDFTGAGGGPFAATAFRSTHVRFKNIKVINELRDGVAFNGDQDAILSDSFVQAGDDTLEIKASCFGYGAGGAGSNPRHNIFENTETISSGGRPFEMTDLNTGANGCFFPGATTEVSDIHYRRIDILHPSLETSADLTGGPGVIAINDPYPVRIHGVSYEDIFVENNVGGNPPVQFDVSATAVGAYGSGAGTIEKVLFRNVSLAYDSPPPLPVIITLRAGGGQSTVSNILFEDLIVDTKRIRAPGPALQVRPEAYPATHVTFR